MTSYVSCKSFKELKHLCTQNGNFDTEKIEKAYQYANEIHKNQKRRSGEPYIIHPIHVAEIVFKIGGDENMVCAALLHDTIEDTEDDVKTVRDNINNNFGEDILFLVEAVSKDCSIEGKVERHNDFIKQIEEAFELDMSVFFLKASDILHNLSTLESLKPEKQEKWINELKYSYIPLFQKYFHRIALPYRKMYENLINELESIIERYEKNLEK